MNRQEIFFTLHITESEPTGKRVDDSRRYTSEVLTALNYIFAIRDPLYIAHHDSIDTNPPSYVQFDRSRHQALLDQFWVGSGKSYLAKFLTAAQNRTNDARRDNFGYIRFPSKRKDPLQGSVRRLGVGVQMDISLNLIERQTKVTRMVQDVLEARMECNAENQLTAAYVLFRLEHKDFTGSSPMDTGKASLLYVWDILGAASPRFHEEVARVIRG